MLYARMLYSGFASYECEPWPFLPWCTTRRKPCTFCAVGQIPPTKLSLFLLIVIWPKFVAAVLESLQFWGHAISLLQAALSDLIHTVGRVRHQATQATRSCLSDKRNFLQQIVSPKLLNNHLVKDKCWKRQHEQQRKLHLRMITCSLKRNYFNRQYIFKQIDFQGTC